MEKPTVLITGVAGFIGSNLADRLIAEGYPVIGIDNLSQGIRENVPAGVTFHQADIRSPELAKHFEGVQVVFHLAAKNSLLDCQQDPVGTMDNNVVGTANVFDAARRAGVRKVVYAQSSVVEEGEARRKGFYAISKIADEQLADGFHAAFGLTTVGLRYFNLYGPRQDYRRTFPPVMSKFIITLLKGGTPVLFEGDEENRRDFVHVYDVNDFHLQCIEDARVDNRVFRLGSGTSHSMAEVLEVAKRVTGIERAHELRPRMEGDVPTQTLADISDARALGWEPKISLAEGMQSMVEYIRREMDAGRIS